MASLAAFTAVLAAMAFLSMQGIWTRPATGSQVRPRLCSIPISAAFSIWRGDPPNTAQSPAAAMEQALPTSAWHPPSAPEMLASFLHRYPTAKEVRKKVLTFSQSPSRKAYM